MHAIKSSTLGEFNAYVTYSAPVRKPTIKHTTTSPPTKVCEDIRRYRSDCPELAKAGFCVRGPNTTEHTFTFMNTNCKKSCDVCTTGKVFEELILAFDLKLNQWNYNI